MRLNKTQRLHKAAIQMENARKEVKRLQAEIFPAFSAVWVDSAAYKGAGMVSDDQPNEAHLLSVRLCHGYDRWYPITHCTPLKRKEHKPDWLKKMARKCKHNRTRNANKHKREEVSP